MREKLLKEIKSNKLIYTLLLLVVLVGLFVRIYRVDVLLEFYFDQGRDAKVIWEFINNGKPFLVGPVTGLEGVFLGPFFYYLLLIPYFLGSGNPVFPAYFFGIMSSISVLAIYYLGFRSHSRVAGLIAATIWAFSYYLLIYGRWLSNPSPMLLISPLLFVSLINISEKKGEYWWIITTLLIGLSLHLELASAFFYIPGFLLFILLNYKNIPSFKIITASLMLLLITVIPQIVFNLRHDNVLIWSLIRALRNNNELNLSFNEILLVRRDLYSKIFSSIIFPSGGTFFFAYFWGLAAIYIANFRKLISNSGVKIFILFLASPLIGFLFFRANQGNVFDYYFIGYFAPFVVLISIGLTYLYKNWVGWIFLAAFFIFFLKDNLHLISNYLQKGRAPYTFSDQKNAVSWIINDADSEFNFYAWVPPIIPHSYDYLLTWIGPGRLDNSKDVNLIYTLHEEPGFQIKERDAWLRDKERFSLIEKEFEFGGITVERRKRL